MIAHPLLSASLILTYLLYLVVHYSAPQAPVHSGEARGAPQHSVPKSCRRANANVMLLSLGTLKNDPVIMDR